MYLAIVSTTLDDIPLRLTLEHADAKRALEECEQANLDARLATLNRDGASVCCGLIVAFDRWGVPVELVETVELPQFAADTDDN